MFYIAFVLAITALAIWLHRARTAPSLFYGGVIAGTVIGLALILILARNWPHLVWTFDFSAPRMQTTFVAAGSTAQVLVPILLILILPGAFWLLEKNRAMYHPAFTRWMIWPPLNAAFITPGLLFLLASALDDPAPVLSRLAPLHQALTMLGGACLVLLYPLIIWCALRRHRETRR